MGIEPGDILLVGERTLTRLRSLPKNTFNLKIQNLSLQSFILNIITKLTIIKLYSSFISFNMNIL